MRFIRYTLITLSLIFCLSLTANAQTEDQLAQALDKALATIEAKDAVIWAKDERIAAQDEVIGLLRLLREADQREKEALRAEADRLRAIKCQESSWGFKPFGWKIFGGTKKECY